jgi:alpha-beta hydrolase superfamily lysophospholipase
VRVRALLAMAESSEFAAEARAFCAKAGALAATHGIEPALLRFPRQPIQVAVIVAELQRLQAVLEDYEADPKRWETKSAEWSACLDDYDMVLEAAAEIVQRPVPRLPYGSRRHFRPEERTEIEALLRARVVTADA